MAQEMHECLLRLTVQSFARAVPKLGLVRCVLATQMLALVQVQRGAFCDTCCIQDADAAFLQPFCKHTSPREPKSTQRHDRTHILGDSEEVPFRPRYSRDTAAFRPLDVGESTATKNGEASRELPAPVSRRNRATADADQIERPARRRRRFR